MTRRLLLALALLGLGGCNWWYNDVPSPDDLMHSIPWFDHMLMSKAEQPYQSAKVPRVTPPGSVPLGNPEADWRVGDPEMLRWGFDTVVANRLAHPTTGLQPGSRSGQQVFDTYCAVCHGSRGDANAPVREMAAPSLLTAQARALADGYIYSMIRYGRGRMPQYGDKIFRIDERWAVVDYVRALQGAAPGSNLSTTAAAPGKGVGGGR